MGRILYFDILKILSAFAVVVMHVAVPMIKEGDTSAGQLAVQFIGGATRFAVPVFLMVSGAMLLDKDIVSIRSFYRKCFLRYFVPVVIWLMVYKIGPCIINGYDRYDCLYLVKTKNPAFHLWYMWMFIGLCLGLPFIRMMVDRTSERLMYMYFAIWGVYAFGVNILEVATGGIYNYNSVFNVFLGYFILGYFMSSAVRIDTHSAVWAGVVLLCSLVSGLLYVIRFCGNSQILNAQYGFCSVNSLFCCVITLSLFALAKYRFNRSHTSAIINALSRATFGIYLIHVLVLTGVDRFLALYPEQAATVTLIAVKSVAVFGLSCLAVLAAKRIRLLSFAFP